jgi:UDP-MurNAc hydroxylase
LQITYYSNACCVMTHEGRRLLTDPWLTDGAFHGAWFSYPPLVTRPQDLTGVDYLYLSHLHPDHFDEATLAHFRRDIPIVALDHGPAYLCRALERLGFTNIVRMRDQESRALGPFEVTMFAPFAGNPFFDTTVGNLLDSALLVRAGGHSVLDTNDNTPTLEAARALRARHGALTVAQLNYNAAGSYPSCFQNLDDGAKQAAHARILERNLAHMVEVARILEPRYVMPFAGAYVIGGKEWRKNRVLGTTTLDGAADYLRAHAPELAPITLNEGLTFDLDRGQIIDGSYRPIDVAAQAHYIETELSRRLYPYERERVESSAALLDFIRASLPAARDFLWSKQQQLGFSERLNFYVQLPGENFRFDFASPGSTFVPASAPFEEPYVASALDPRLLAMILRGDEHWNNAQIGCHVDFVRAPEVYQPDVYTLLSFLHLPPGRVRPAAQASRSRPSVPSSMRPRP